MKKSMIIVVVIFFMAYLFYNQQFNSGNPIFPETYDLMCRDINSGEFIKMNDSCGSTQDCLNWTKSNCGAENGCSNVKTECVLNHCKEIQFFQLNRSCV